VEKVQLIQPQLVASVEMEELVALVPVSAVVAESLFKVIPPDQERVTS